MAKVSAALGLDQKVKMIRHQKAAIQQKGETLSRLSSLTPTPPTRSLLKHPAAPGIYLLGSGAWRVVDVVPVEEDLEVPVVHPVAACVWYVQKQMRVRQSVTGAGRLLAQLPSRQRLLTRSARIHYSTGVNKFFRGPCPALNYLALR